jgi:U4/U6.U5 tri-snRNP-associated protein 2
MASRKQFLPPSMNGPRTSDERPAKRAKVDDVNHASTSSVEPSDTVTTGAALLSEDEEGLEDEVGPGQSNNEPRASDLYLDTVRHPMTLTRYPLTWSLDQSSTP